MPICKCFCRGFLFAELPEWAQRKHVEEMTMRKTMKVKRVPDEGKKGNGIDKEDTLNSVISTISRKCRCDLQSTKAETYEGS